MEQENQMHKKYGLWTAICMVVGTVIGSGVFFKAQSVLDSNNGNMFGSLLTVLLVGMIMLVCSYCFSLLAARVERVNGLVDYSEMALGKAYAYFVGWFITTIFYPTLTSCLAWISANYTLVLFGASDVHWVWHLGLTLLYMLLSFALNVISPKLSGKFQVSTTFIKLVPLAAMAVIGTIVGLFSGTLAENATYDASAVNVGGDSGGFFGAVVAFAFAFEGWIFATCINAELKDAKKNLPRALFFGAIVIIAVYMGYFLGVFGVLKIGDIMSSENLPKDAFSTLFGNPVFGTIAYVFVVVSCLGTMNGLMLACCRGIYSVSARGEGPFPKFFSKVNRKCDMPIRSSLFGLALSVIWALQWQFGFINGKLPSVLSFENDELPIITFYACCIPIFICIMTRCRDLGKIKRFVIPALAIISCLFMVFAAIYKYKIQALYYLIIFAVFMIIGALFYRVRGKTLAVIIAENTKRLFKGKK